MLKRRALGAAVTLVGVALLSSCALLPGFPVANPGDSSGNPDVQMQHIADAVKNHDAAALKKVFTPRAREKATDLDSGLKYFLSIFPSGRMTWKSLGASSSDDVDDNGKETVVLYATYKVSADGKEYDLFFADYTVNQAEGSENLGIYSLGVAPYTSHPLTAPRHAQAFIRLGKHRYPGRLHSPEMSRAIASRPDPHHRRDSQQ